MGATLGVGIAQELELPAFAVEKPLHPRCFCKSAQALERKADAGDSRREKCEKSAQMTDRKGDRSAVTGVNGREELREGVRRGRAGWRRTNTTYASTIQVLVK
jgi:hypothetical protein